MEQLPEKVIHEGEINGNLGVCNVEKNLKADPKQYYESMYSEDFKDFHGQSTNFSKDD